MNYLAHATLSFGNAEILTGNIIGDFVKGKEKLTYPVAIQKGITLHRLIDEFTDTHSITKQAKMFLGNQPEAMHQFLLTWYTIIF